MTMTTPTQAIHMIVQTDQPLDIGALFPKNKKPATVMVVIIPQEEIVQAVKPANKKGKKSQYERAMEDYHAGRNICTLDSYMKKR
jgi:hypothetical protein